MLPLTAEQKQSLLDLRTLIENAHDDNLEHLALTYITWERYLHTSLEDALSSAINVAHLAISTDETERGVARKIMALRITEVLGVSL